MIRSDYWQNCGGTKNVNEHGARRLQRPDQPEVSFILDGETRVGFAGEPIAVALLATGVRVFRQMPESGEVRGGFCFVGRCADCMVTVDGQSGVRACVTPLKPGMSIQTGWAADER